MSLCIFQYWTAENEQSPEFRYLQSVLLTLARRVFADAQITTWRPGATEPKGADGEYILLLGRQNIWMTAGTLRDMKAAIDSGAAWAVPSSLSAISLGAYEPLYTARDFEQLERQFAADPPTIVAAPASHLPVSLMSRRAFDEAAAGTPLSRLLVEPLSLERASGPVARAGFFLEFSDYYGEARADLLPHLPAVAEDVLEIGCGRGLTGKLIEARLGCRVTGIEQHAGAAAEAAQNVSRVIVGDVMEVAIDGRYDAIVASELLEHVSDPEVLLTRLRGLLKPGGRFVLSVPNVGHYSIVEDLLAGRWDYVPVGLLCYTHLRFFTRQTLADWATRLGFTCAIVPQVTELPDRFLALPATFEHDLESLRTKGFYVVLTPLDGEAAH